MPFNFRAEGLAFLTANQIILTYTPFEVLGVNGFPMTTFGLYATSVDNNALCNFAYGVASRRKRSLAINSGLGDSGRSLNDSVANALPQQLITDVIRNATEEVNQRLTDCCNTTITEVRVAELEPEVTAVAVESSDDDGSTTLMAIMLGVLLPLIFILVIITVVMLFVKM